MSEPIPNQPTPPIGGVPPKPAEAAKVQPKKETVRIALPPKPTSAPTIKLPSLPPTGAAPAAAGSPTAAPTGARPTVTATPTTQIPRPALAAPTATGAAPTATRPGTSVARPPAPAPAKAPAPPAGKAPAAARTVGTFDTVLAVVAMLVGIGAILSVLSLIFGPFALK